MNGKNECLSMTILYVFLGGGLGAISRFGISNLLNANLENGKIPLAVMGCNVLGCFFTGILFAIQTEHSPSWIPPLLITGFLGGFTTFSSFGLETFKLVDSGHFSSAALYISLSLIGSLAALFLAIKIIR